MFGKLQKTLITLGLIKYSHVRGACAIADGDSVILIGGAGDDDVPQHGVTRYNMMGYVEDLPELQEARHHHGCASFIRDNSNVRQMRKLKKNLSLLSRFSL